MKNTIFTGAATAIVTPLNENGIDFDAFAKLIEWQIAEGIDAARNDQNGIAAERLCDLKLASDDRLCFFASFGAIVVQPIIPIKSACHAVKLNACLVCCLLDGGKLLGGGIQIDLAILGKSDLDTVKACLFCKCKALF